MVLEWFVACEMLRGGFYGFLCGSIIEITGSNKQMDVRLLLLQYLEGSLYPEN